MPGYLLTVHKYAPICTTPEQVFNYWFPYLIQPTLLFKLSYPPDIVPREAAGRSALPLEMFQDTLHLSDNSQCILCHLQEGFKTVAYNRWLIWRREFDFCFLSAISPANSCKSANFWPWQIPIFLRPQMTALWKIALFPIYFLSFIFHYCAKVALIYL